MSGEKPEFQTNFREAFPDDMHSFDLKTSVLKLSKLIDPQLDEKYCLDEIEKFSKELRTRLSSSPSPPPAELLKTVNSYFFKELEFKTDETADKYFSGKIKKIPAGESAKPLHEYLSVRSVLKNRTGIAASIVLIYLMIAEELYMPVFAAVTPNNLYLRYDDGNEMHNIDLLSEGSLIESSRTVRDEIIYNKSLEPFYTAGLFLTKISKYYESRNMYDEAKIVLKRAGEVNPDLAENHYDFGRLYFREENYPEAEKSFMKAVDLNPGYAEAYYSLGVIKQKTGAVREAKDYYNKASGVNYSFEEAHYALGALHAETGNYEAAKNSLMEVIVINPQNTDAYYKLCLLYTSPSPRDRTRSRMPSSA